MKPQLFFITLVFLPFCVFSQSNFNPEQYNHFLQQNQNLGTKELINRFQPQEPYYTGITIENDLKKYTYLDSIQQKYNLTTGEMVTLKNYHFVVTERLHFDCFGRAFHDVYIKDLPVFVTTDAVLHALHMSYDGILMDLEISLLEPKLSDIIDELYDAYPQLLDKYKSKSTLHSPLKDVDMYITVAKSLLNETKQSPQFVEEEVVDAIWEAIRQEKAVDLPLFSERKRHLDFSQFTVRGHYTQRYWDGETMTTLGSYFQTMMWLGRMDFFLTPPPSNPWEPDWTREEIRRMNLGAVLLYELLGLAEVRNDLNEIDDMLRFMVGECDNLTPEGLNEILKSEGIQSAEDLLNDTKYDSYLEALNEYPNSGQRILSSILLMDPFDPQPGQLPISFRLMGQRFIMDSYIFSNVVFDRIVYKDKKVWRPLPDPLDAMFALGNDDALPLLKEELDNYHYATQLSALRYLVDAYDAEFWDQSLYNVWLQAIRLLNPNKAPENLPFFMTTTAWHQEKLNTQLASWAQLRHDNLLYAKQSYTGATGCSFPHSYIESYPEFYRQIANFARKADSYFSQFPDARYMIAIKNYFPRLYSVMDKLSVLAQKEVDRVPFSKEEVDFLKRMLFKEGGSGAPPFSGWYADLYYNPHDAAKLDYVVADVHTQPTDRSGYPIGRVLHVGVGEINLGVFLADAPSQAFQPIAFVGPVMSYYEKITKDFDRLTDERWRELVVNGDLPDRPDWTNIYLVDENGQAKAKGRELEGILYTHSDGYPAGSPDQFHLSQNYPNPFNPSTKISYVIPKSCFVHLEVYDLLGEKIRTLVNKFQKAGEYSIHFDASNLPSGIYFYKLRVNDHFLESKKMLLIR